MFPEDRIFTLRELINLWVAEGFTHGEAGEDYLDELISRNLIQVEKRRYDGRIKSCRIHDVLRDLCISIAKEEDFFKIQSGNDSVIISALESRRAAIHQQSIIDNGNSPNHQFPKLRTLLYFHKGYEMPPTILFKNIQEGFRLIRVLRLEGLQNYTRLPDGIGNLVHIRYLYLRGFDLVLPITMGNLKNLEVLDCPDCPFLILPTVILKTEKLRHVFIRRSAKFQDAEVKEVSLPNLQTLSFIDAGLLKADCFRQLTQLTDLGIYCDWKEVTDILKYTTHLSEKLEKLKWEVRYLSILEDLPALNFSGYQNLRELHLDGQLKKLPLFPKNLTKLTLIDTRLENDPMKELGMLPKLKVLKLHIGSYMGDVMVISGPDSFPSLELLVIFQLKVMKIENDDDDGGDRVMPNLQRVKLGRPYINKLDVLLSNRLKRLFKEAIMI